MIDLDPKGALNCHDNGRRVARAPYHHTPLWAAEPGDMHKLGTLVFFGRWIALLDTSYPLDYSLISNGLNALENATLQIKFVHCGELGPAESPFIGMGR
jgi:hypothetical protein